MDTNEANNTDAGNQMSGDEKISIDMIQFITRTLPLSIFNLLRLLLFVAFLLPGFIRFAWFYFIVSGCTSIQYGNESVRQRVDVYMSHKQNDSQLEGREPDVNLLANEYYSNSQCPVVVFCTGGAWIIGYKMWGALLARALTAAGIVVVIPDTRNYPSVTIPHMVNDIDSAIDWTINNISQYGGDPKNIIIVGQSAGGHLACMAIFRKIQAKIVRENSNTASKSLVSSAGGKNMKQRQITEVGKSDDGWLASDLKGFAIISSPVSLGPVMTKSFRHQGFDDEMVQRMFGFEKDRYDPHLVLCNFQTVEERKNFMKELPPISIYQGTADTTVPFEVAETFYQELRKAASDHDSVSFIPYIGWSHTDPILEGPMDADHRLHKDLFHDVNKWTTSPNLSWPNNSKIDSRLCPHFMVTLGRWANPF